MLTRAILLTALLLCYAAILQAETKKPAAAKTVTVDSMAKKPAPAPLKITKGAPIAENPSEISVTRATIALNIVDREPEDTGYVYPPDVRRLYCFTQLKGGSTGDTIEHRWYWNEDLISAVSLGVGSGNFRTYSAKSIPAGMVGEWRVAVVDSHFDTILKIIKFTINNN